MEFDFQYDSLHADDDDNVWTAIWTALIFFFFSIYLACSEIGAPSDCQCVTRDAWCNIGQRRHLFSQLSRANCSLGIVNLVYTLCLGVHWSCRSLYVGVRVWFLCYKIRDSDRSIETLLYGNCAMTANIARTRKKNCTEIFQATTTASNRSQWREWEGSQRKVEQKQQPTIHRMKRKWIKAMNLFAETSLGLTDSQCCTIAVTLYAPPL